MFGVVLEEDPFARRNLSLWDQHSWHSTEIPAQMGMDQHEQYPELELSSLHRSRSGMQHLNPGLDSYLRELWSGRSAPSPCPLKFLNYVPEEVNAGFSLEYLLG